VQGLEVLILSDLKLFRMNTSLFGDSKVSRREQNGATSDEWEGGAAPTENAA